MFKIAVQTDDFDTGVEIAALNQAGVGGIATFIGIVRSDAGNITALHLEHYPGMTERAMQKIATDAAARWPLARCTLIHRVGTLKPGDNIVFVGTASPHRQAALTATAYLIDWLKTAAPFWKREQDTDGQSTWVQPRHVDDQAVMAWGR